MCEELFPDAECILDYYHMAENTHKYAKALYPGDVKKSTRWAKTIMKQIENAEVDKAIKKIKTSPALPENAVNIVNLQGYIEKNRDRIRYKEYEEKGLFIGSGMIESGHKVVIHKRMKQSGMRWSITGAQYMATLRAKYESKSWNDVVDVIYGADKKVA